MVPRAHSIDQNPKQAEAWPCKPRPGGSSHFHLSVALTLPFPALLHPLLSFPTLHPKTTLPVHFLLLFPNDRAKSTSFTTKASANSPIANLQPPLPSTLIFNKVCNDGFCRPDRQTPHCFSASPLSLHRPPWAWASAAHTHSRYPLLLSSSTTPPAVVIARRQCHNFVIPGAAIDGGRIHRTRALT